MTRAAAVLAELRRLSSKKERDGLRRYGIVTDRAFGVPMRELNRLGKELGPDHALAQALWKDGGYEARTLAALVEDPSRVTPAQMERWCREFDTWAICDTVCFKLFDKVPHAYIKLAPWARRREEYVKRAAFALLASLALHDKEQADATFLKGLKLIEQAADDDRNFVKKGVLWALRGIGSRNPKLRAAAGEVADRLASSDEPAARWIGTTALREFRKKSASRRRPAKRRR